MSVDNIFIDVNLCGHQNKPDKVVQAAAATLRKVLAKIYPQGGNFKLIGGRHRKGFDSDGVKIEGMTHTGIKLLIQPNGNSSCFNYILSVSGTWTTNGKMASQLREYIEAQVNKGDKEAEYRRQLFTTESQVLLKDHLSGYFEEKSFSKLEAVISIRSMIDGRSIALATELFDSMLSEKLIVAIIHEEGVFYKVADQLLPDTLSADDPTELVELLSKNLARLADKALQYQNSALLLEDLEIEEIVLKARLLEIEEIKVELLKVRSDSAYSKASEKLDKVARLLK